LLDQSFVKIVDEDQYTKWMLIRCFAHCGKNSGKEAGFPNLNIFWSLIQNIFCQSEAAKCTFKNVIGVSWKSISDNHWWSQFEVLHVIYTSFYCLTVVIINIVVKGAVPVTSAKLLKMLQDRIIVFYINIELAAFIEGLNKVVEFTYGPEADGQLVFTFGDKIVELVSFYPNKGLCNLPSKNTMILDAVEWANEEGYEAPVPVIIRQSVKQVSSTIHFNRPHHERAVASVRAATHAGETMGKIEHHNREPWHLFMRRHMPERWWVKWNDETPLKLLKHQPQNKVNLMKRKGSSKMRSRKR
jgi:hypothetical protein